MSKKHIIIGVFALFFLSYIFYILSTTKITIEFKDLEPLKHRISVYYNGFKLGKSIRVYPSENYTTTSVDIRIKLKNLKLPKNTYAILRRKDKVDYIELEYPKTPYIEHLKNNDTIEGHLGVNFENYLQNQAESGGLDEIKENVNIAIKSAGETFNALTIMINTLNSILTDLKPSINNTFVNFNLTSENLLKSSKALKTSLEKGYLENSLKNLELTTNNLSNTTINTNNFTNNLNQKSIVLLNCLLSNINTLINNVNEIIIGLGNTLKERFGGLKLFFGKTIR